MHSSHSTWRLMLCAILTAHACAQWDWKNVTMETGPSDIDQSNSTSDASAGVDVIEDKHLDIDRVINLPDHEISDLITFRANDVVIPGASKGIHVPVTLPADITPDTDVIVRAVSGDRDMAEVASEPDLTFLEDGVVDVNMLILGGSKFGVTDVNVTLQFISNGTETMVVKTHEVTVLRPPRKVRVQMILEYISAALCIFVMFFAGAASTFYEIRKAWAWILGCLLLQLIVMPLLCLAFVEIFRMEIFRKLGVLATAYSPVGLACIALAVCINADLGLTSSLIILNYLLANISMPLWGLQFRHIDPYQLSTSDTPFGAIDATLVISLLIFVLGMLVRHCMSETAESIVRGSPVVAGVTVAFVLLSSLIGGGDLFASVAWKEIMLCIFWPLILLGCIVVVFTMCHITGPRFRAAVLFLTVKGFYVPNALVMSSLPFPESHVCEATVFFFSLMTLILAASVAVCYACFMCVVSDADEIMNPPPKPRNEELRLVMSREGASATGGSVESPPPYDDPSANASPPKSRYDVIGESLTIRMAEANANAAVFGVPTMTI